MNGKSIEAEIDEQIVFNWLSQNKNAIWSLFLASGYLKVVNVTRNALKQIEEKSMLRDKKSVIASIYIESRRIGTLRLQIAHGIAPGKACGRCIYIIC